MASLIHEAACRIIRERHGAQSAGFARAMGDLFDWEDPKGECIGCENEPCTCEMEYREGIREFKARFNFKPDAWKVEAGVVTCWEVTVTAGLASKEAAYIDAFWALDEVGAELRLVHVDAGGSESPVDLFRVAYENAAQERDD